MRKSLGSKRNAMDESDIATITRCFGQFEVVERADPRTKPAETKSNRGRQAANPKPEAVKTFASKIFADVRIRLSPHHHRTRPLRLLVAVRAMNALPACAFESGAVGRPHAVDLWRIRFRLERYA